MSHLINNDSDDPVVHRITVGWRIILYLCALFALVVILLPTIFFIREQPPIIGQIIAGILALGASVAVCAWAARIRNYRIELLSDRIRYRGAWFNRELATADVRGFRILPTQYVRTLLIEPRDKRLKKISTALVYERGEEMLTSLASKTTNLDHEEHVDELMDIATETAYGSSEETRLAKLGVARKYAKSLNAAGMIFGVWAFIYPYPYDLAVSGLLLLPVVALAVVKKFGGLIHLDGKKNSAYPNVAAAVIIPPLILMLRSMLDWNMLRWADAWPVFLAFSSGSMILLLFSVAHARRSAGHIAGGLILSALYAYGAGLYLNCRNDSSEPRVYQCHVQDAHVSHGKHTSYILSLAPFIDGENSRDVEVPRAVYERHKPGDNVRVYLKSGVLGIPWFWVR